MAVIQNAASDNVSPFSGQQQQTGGNGRRNFQKSDRLININIPTVNEDGSEGSIRLSLGGLKLSDPNEAKLIEWLDADPEQNLPVLFAEMAKVSTYVDATKKKERGFAFMK